MYDRKKIRSAKNVTDVSFFVVHRLNISQKELIYLLQKSISIETKYYVHAPRGIDW